MFKTFDMRRTPEKIRLKLGDNFHNFLRNEVHSVSTPLHLEKLTRCSLVKAYYSVVLPEHWACKCYYCEIMHAVLVELPKRGQIVLLRSCVDLQDLEKEDENLPFFSTANSPYLSVDFKNRKE